MVLMLMVMLVTTGAAFMVFVLMMVMLMFVMMSAAAAFMMLMTAEATFMMRMVFMVMMLVAVFLMAVTVSAAFTGDDHHIRFHLASNRKNLGQQGIGILRGDPQLLGGEGDGCGLHFGHGVDFFFYTGGAVGAVQIVNDVHFLLHR